MMPLLAISNIYGYISHEVFYIGISITNLHMCSRCSLLFSTCRYRLLGLFSLKNDKLVYKQERASSQCVCFLTYKLCIYVYKYIPYSHMSGPACRHLAYRKGIKLTRTRGRSHRRPVIIHEL